MRRSVYFLLSVAVFMGLGCTGDGSIIDAPGSGGNVSPVHLSKAARQVVASGNQFSFTLLQETVKQNPGETVFLSPLSASMALAMACNGARTATEEEIRTMLGYGGLTQADLNESCKTLYDVLTTLDPKVTLKIANAIWNDYTLAVLPSFIQVNQQYFNTEVDALNFKDPSALEVINSWCDLHTNGRIPKILDQLDPATVLAILNALYFKGTWTIEFDKTNTRDDIFNLAGGGTMSCKMMRVTEKFSYLQNDELAAVDLPYGDGHFSMTLMLPKQGMAIDEFVNRCTAAQWEIWKQQFTLREGTVDMPKLKVEYDVTLNDILMVLGMVSAFSPGAADFSGISATDRLFISLVKQKTFLQIDEEGTEAAAITAILFERTSTGSGSDRFFLRLDRPYVLMIRDHATDSILFIGKIMEPKN